MDTLPDIYNSLGDVYEVSEKIASRPNALPALAKLLVKYKLDKVYDIRLNHKHFDITGGEQVVGFTGSDSMVSSVCTNGELPVKQLAGEGITPVSGGTVRPSDFIVKDGVAIPYEFTYTKNSPGTIPSPEFLDEWCTILREEGLEGLLGLCIRDQDVPIDAHEVSDSKKRVNTLHFRDAPEEGVAEVATAWRAHEVNDVIEVKQCIYCKRIEDHGNKCNAK